MITRTLAGRVSLVQCGLTLAALAAVVLGTAISVETLLARKRDAVLDETARRGAELVKASGVYAQDGDWMDRELSEIRPADVRLELQDPSGFVLASSGAGTALGKASIGCEDRAKVRVCATRAGIFAIAAASDRSRDSEELHRVLISLIAVAGGAGMLVGLVSRYAARRALSPLTELTGRVAEILPGQGGRVGSANDFAELELFRARFDDLMSRFDDALSREKRLTAQASHELRTPLAVARGEIEVLMQTGNIEAGGSRAIAALDRLSELVQALLWFARAEERLDDDRMAVVNVADLVRQQVEERAARRSDCEIICSLPDELLVRGDEHLLGLATGNLLDNALKYGGAEGVGISAELRRSSLRLLLSNFGSLPEAPERLFEPFQRGTSAASLPGFGLGLPLARGVLRAHGGDVELEPAGARQVLCVVTLPLLDWSPEEIAGPRSVGV